MIPKIIHQIWVGDFKMPLREQELIKKTKDMHPDYEYIFWTSVNKEELPENARTAYNIFYDRKDFVFCADILRIWAVYNYGGFYLDVDWELKNKLDDFLNFDNAFWYHNDMDFTIPNNVFGAKKESDIFKFCLNQINPNWNGPSWFGAVVKDYLNLPYEIKQNLVEDALKNKNSGYFNYGVFETNYAKHLSLYSWEPKTWEKLNNGEQL